MKNMFKKGFSLAELLLCITIIGLVSAMGMTIAKHSSDRAYNLFYYTGYINLYNSLADAIAVNEEEGEGDNNATGKYLETVYETLHSSNDAIAVNSTEQKYPNGLNWPTDSSSCITASNGIKYYYTTPGSDYIAFLMTVPQRKTRANNGVSSTRLLFLNKEQGYLIPMAGGDVNLFQRRDLLPAYIDNGKVGRNNALDRTQGFSFEPIRYASFKDAFCTLHSDGLSVVNCAGYSSITPNSGALKVANPQKAR